MDRKELRKVGVVAKEFQKMNTSELRIIQLTAKLAGTVYLTLNTELLCTCL
jgi:hypothetical protein